MYHKLTYGDLISGVYDVISTQVKTQIDSLQLWKNHSTIKLSVKRTSSYVIPFDCLVCSYLIADTDHGLSSRVFDDGEVLDIYNSYDFGTAYSYVSDSISWSTQVGRWFVERGSIITTNYSSLEINVVPLDTEGSNQSYPENEYSFGLSELSSGEAFSNMTGQLQYLSCIVLPPSEEYPAPSSFNIPICSFGLSCTTMPGIFCSVNCSSTILRANKWSAENLKYTYSNSSLNYHRMLGDVSKSVIYECGKLNLDISYSGTRPFKIKDPSTTYDAKDIVYHFKFYTIEAY